MSRLMLAGVLRMPFGLAMGDELSRRQFYARAQEALAQVEALEQANLQHVTEFGELQDAPLGDAQPVAWQVTSASLRYWAVFKKDFVAKSAEQDHKEAGVKDTVITPLYAAPQVEAAPVQKPVAMASGLIRPPGYHSHETPYSLKLDQMSPDERAIAVGDFRKPKE